MMKEYQVETLIRYSKITLDAKHIAKLSKKEIQQKLDAMAKEVWTLSSTDATSFGTAVQIYSYFETDFN